MMEDCLSTGKPMMIENIEEEIDPVLDPVLEKRIIKKGRNYILPLADKEVDFDVNFQLFITTRLPNPHYTPELCAKVTLIDFTVTMVGLEDQLLGRLISKEKSELEEQRQELMEEVQSYKKKIKQLEDDLLDRLSNSQVRPAVVILFSLLCQGMHCFISGRPPGPPVQLAGAPCWLFCHVRG